MNPGGRAGVIPGVIGVLATALLGLAATSYDIHTTASNTYSPQGLRARRPRRAPATPRSCACARSARGPGA